ncbi:MAG: hypothetical protein KDB01_12170 [Planctomycetaceae bacterium]|nr:hypothetical protein [Planctomycetaceae bacterium]
MTATRRDPSPDEIAAACLEIQSTWTPRERLTRLRADLRPSIVAADGRHVDVSAGDYETHLANHAACQGATE